MDQVFQSGNVQFSITYSGSKTACAKTISYRVISKLAMASQRIPIIQESFRAKTGEFLRYIHLLYKGND